jgi:hypothetical protein
LYLTSLLLHLLLHDAIASATVVYEANQKQKQLATHHAEILDVNLRYFGEELVGIIEHTLHDDNGEDKATRDRGEAVIERECLLHSIFEVQN